MRMRKGRVPKEPFISWWDGIRKRRAFQFQREHQRSEESKGSGWGETNRKRIPEREVILRQFDTQGFCNWCGITENEYNRLLKAAMKNPGKGQARSTIDLGLVDRILTKLGRPELLNLWYPIECFDEEGRWTGVEERKRAA